MTLSSRRWPAFALLAVGCGSITPDVRQPPAATASTPEAIRYEPLPDAAAEEWTTSTSPDASRGHFASLAGSGGIASGFSNADIDCSEVLANTSWGTIGWSECLRRAPTARPGSPIVGSGYAARTVRRRVKRELAAITRCYERALTAEPALAGTVTVTFVIAADGTVASSIAHGLAAVDACVAAVISATVFPKPKRDGDVMVSYPFTFDRAR